MGIPIEVTDNIRECIEILNGYVNGKGEIDRNVAINALNYLNVTVLNATKSSIEAKGCPHPRKLQAVK